LTGWCEARLAFYARADRRDVRRPAQAFDERSRLGISGWPRF
jgi:hypothetical protein